MLVSMLGTWVQSVAVMWLAYGLSGSTWFTGLIGFLNSVPHLFLAPFAGVLGDRVDRRKVLVVVLTLLALQAAALAVLSGLHLITMVQLAALSAVSFSISPYATLMPAMAVRTFARGAELVGLFIGAVGLGAFVAALMLARRPSVRGLGKWIPAAAIIGGLGAIGFGLSRNVWASAFLM